MVSTDRQGYEGYNTERGVTGDYTDRDGSYFSGTSAATPVAAGVVALMLEANERLGYRDVQEILAYSSKRVPLLEHKFEYALNGSTDWNGGALANGQAFGYGHIDAHAAVRLAESWLKTSTVGNLVIEEGNIDQRSLTVGSGSQGEVRSWFGPDHRVEQRLVTVDLETEHLEWVTLELVAPSGMVSTIMHQPPLYDPEKHDARYELPTELEYTFSTVRHWGENLAGDWVLRVIADSQGSPVTLNDWSIQAYTAGSGLGTQIFTDEYSWFVGIEPERTDIDAANGDTLNAAAVLEDVRFDLATGTGAIGATTLTLTDAANMRHLISGDGNDVLIGNDAGNILMGGRGTNHIDGGAGLDVVRLIGNYEQHRIEETDGALVVHKQGLAAGGLDVLSNVELLVFADQVVLANKPARLDADLFDESAYLAQNPDVAAAVDQGAVASGGPRPVSVDGYERLSGSQH